MPAPTLIPPHLPDLENKQAFLTWRDHLHLRAAADCLASAVGAARVGALVPGPQVVDQQCAIWGLADAVAISPYRQPVPGRERTPELCPGPRVFRPQDSATPPPGPRARRQRVEVIKDCSRASCSLSVGKQVTRTSRKR